MKYLLVILFSCSGSHEYKTIQHFQGMTVVEDLRTGQGYLIDTIVRFGIHRLDLK